MRFSKMHGLGNDFMVIDAVTQNISLSQKLIRQLSDRKISVGFDQLLLVEPSYNPNFDFHYRIFNADGNEVEQCGNGARCFAYFVHLKGLTNKRNIHVSTINRCMVLSIINDGLVCVNMGEPNFKPSLIPFNANKIKNIYFIQTTEQIVSCSVVSIGNPHCIILVDDIRTVAFEKLGSELESHKLFPKKTNIGFMQIIKRNHILLRVYERGIGETKSCGSGACAAVAVGIIQGLLAEKVNVELPGGYLNISWRGLGYPLYMIGPATHVYDGFIYL